MSMNTDSGDGLRENLDDLSAGELTSAEKAREVQDISDALTELERSMPYDYRRQEIRMAVSHLDSAMRLWKPIEEATEYMEAHKEEMKGMVKVEDLPPVFKEIMEQLSQKPQHPEGET